MKRITVSIITAMAVCGLWGFSAKLINRPGNSKQGAYQRSDTTRPKMPLDTLKKDTTINGKNMAPPRRNNRPHKGGSYGAPFYDDPKNH